MQLSTFPPDTFTLILKPLSYEKQKEKALIYFESNVMTYRYKVLIPHSLNALLQCTELQYSYSWGHVCFSNERMILQTRLIMVLWDACILFSHLTRLHLCMEYRHVKLMSEKAQLSELISRVFEHYRLLHHIKSWELQLTKKLNPRFCKEFKLHHWEYRFITNMHTPSNLFYHTKAKFFEILSS